MTVGTGKDVFVYIKGDSGDTGDTISSSGFNPGTGRGEEEDTIRIEGYTSEELGGARRDNVDIDDAGVMSISGTTIIITNNSSTHPSDINYVVKP